MLPFCRAALTPLLRSGWQGTDYAAHAVFVPALDADVLSLPALGSNGRLNYRLLAQRMCAVVGKFPAGAIRPHQRPRAQIGHSPHRSEFPKAAAREKLSAGRKFVREMSPRAAGSEHVEDHVHDDVLCEQPADAEWVLLEPLIPPPCDQGRPRLWPLREIRVVRERGHFGDGRCVGGLIGHAGVSCWAR